MVSRQTVPRDGLLIPYREPRIQRLELLHIVNPHVEASTLRRSSNIPLRLCYCRWKNSKTPNGVQAEE